MIAVVVGVFAQTCATLLPLSGAELEWFRDGRPFARDVPGSASENSRVYRREHQNGRIAQRTISCTMTGNASFLVDRMEGGVTVRFPIALEIGTTHAAGGVAVRRIAAPSDAISMNGSLWFTVSRPSVAVYGIAPGAGVVEIRSPSPSGGFSVLRAVVRDPAPAVAAAANAGRLAEAAARERLLRRRISALETVELSLRDSITTLNIVLQNVNSVPHSPEDVPELIAVGVYVERGEYQAAIDLLLDVSVRLREWSVKTGARHRALDKVDTRLRGVLADCAAAAAALPRPSPPITCSLGNGGR